MKIIIQILKILFNKFIIARQVIKNSKLFGMHQLTKCYDTYYDLTVKNNCLVP